MAWFLLPPVDSKEDLASTPSYVGSVGHEEALMDYLDRIYPLLTGNEQMATRIAAQQSFLGWSVRDRIRERIVPIANHEIFQSLELLMGLYTDLLNLNANATKVGARLERLYNEMLGAARNDEEAIVKSWLGYKEMGGDE